MTARYAGKFGETEAASAALGTLLWSLVSLIGFIMVVISGFSAMRVYWNRKPEVQQKKILRAGGPDSSPAACHAQFSKARELYGALRSGAVLQGSVSATIPMYGDEKIYSTGRVEYTRYYGQHFEYEIRSTVAFGRPSFIIGAAIGDAIAASRRERMARQMAVPRWQECQFVDIWVTDRRIITVASGRWLEFWYEALVAVYPDPSNFELTLEFRDTQPLRLVGPSVAMAAVLVEYFTMGRDGLLNHPSFASLRGGEG